MATSSAYGGAGRDAEIIRDDAVAVGSHVLQLEGFKKLEAAFRAGECVHSSSFLVGGHSWHLSFYPCGDGEDEDVHFALKLCLESTGGGVTDQVRARFGFSLLGPVGEALDAWDDLEHAFSSSENSHGCDFIACGYDANVRFRIRCDIIIVKEFRPHGKSVEESPWLDLQRHLGELLAAGKAPCDVTFAVAGDTLAAHKCILAARSPVFMAEFFGPGNSEATAAAAAAHVRVVEGMDPKVFKALLHFIYTDKLPYEIAYSDEVANNDQDTVKMLQDLIVAADRYNMERLKLICDDALSYLVDASTAATALQLAEKHGCPRLKHACINLLRDLLDSVCSLMP